MKWSIPNCCLFLAILLTTFTGCAFRSPTIVQNDRVIQLPPGKWREIQEEIWTASTLAHFEAESFAHEAMQEWMKRVREKTTSEFIPWYTGYWAQQWIGLKAGWYEMNREEGEPPVADYLVTYINKRYYDLVLEPAGMPLDPRLISEQSAAQYVRMLSEQLQYIPEMYSVSLPSLQQKLERISLIKLHDEKAKGVSLSVLLERASLTGVGAYDSLLAQTGVSSVQGKYATRKEPLQVVVEDTVARLVAELPVRAGGSAAALLAGETLGLFISAGVVAWSMNAHEQKKPDIESQLSSALDSGLNQMWERLMKDPELGVLFPVNHMQRQIEKSLFPVEGQESPARQTRFILDKASSRIKL